MRLNISKKIFIIFVLTGRMDKGREGKEGKKKL